MMHEVPSYADSSICGTRSYRPLYLWCRHLEKIVPSSFWPSSTAMLQCAAGFSGAWLYEKKPFAELHNDILTCVYLLDANFYDYCPLVTLHKKCTDCSNVLLIYRDMRKCRFHMHAHISIEVFQAHACLCEIN